MSTVYLLCEIAQAESNKAGLPCNSKPASIKNLTSPEPSSDTVSTMPEASGEESTWTKAESTFSRCVLVLSLP